MEFAMLMRTGEPAVQREAPTATLSLVDTWFAIGPSR
jgi:hypothetical protein